MSILETVPHPGNFCGGSFQDWIEVNLVPECNARCKWCVEKIGYHPTNREDWQTIGKAAIDTGKKNIILLGGEPTLFRDLKLLIDMLLAAERHVYVTTNGSRINREFVESNLRGISGLNISVHHYELKKNADITGLLINKLTLQGGIVSAREQNIRVRLNCNAIRGYIDNEEKIHKYLKFVKEMFADCARFAELKLDTDSFVDLQTVLEGKYGLNNDPFILGCNHDAEIDGVPVNFRQMCGLQTPFRKKPVNPKQFAKNVLYYDGKIYDGWQSPQNIGKMAKRQILEDLAKGKITVGEAERYFV